jgi:hypothetical protein
VFEEDKTPPNTLSADWLLHHGHIDSAFAHCAPESKEGDQVSDVPIKERSMISHISGITENCISRVFLMHHQFNRANLFAFSFELIVYVLKLAQAGF